VRTFVRRAPMYKHTVGHSDIAPFEAADNAKRG
jgi:hypothetical protein